MVSKAAISRRTWHHWPFALAVFAVGVTTIYFLADLRANAPNTLGALSAFGTFYGIVFAIIELRRTKTAATLAAESAREAADAVQRTYNLRDSSECITCIEFALADLEQDAHISSAALSRILKLYAAEFHIEISQDTSNQRRNQLILESYVLPDGRASDARKAGKLKQALMSMTTELTTRTISNMTAGERS